jgi:hypothetical protein
MDVVAAREVARRKIGVADHMVTQTYALVSDPKILLAALQNVFDAVDAGIHALLLAEEHEKHLPKTPDDFESRLTAFKLHVVSEHKVPEGFLRFVSELRETLQEHKKSAVEFVRHDQYVIADNDYNLKTLSPESVRKYVQQAKVFVAMMEEKVNDAAPA